MKFNLNYDQSAFKPDAIREIPSEIEYTEPRKYRNISRYSTTRCIKSVQSIHLNPYMSQAFENVRAKEHHETAYRYWPKVSKEYEVYTVNNSSENRLDIIAQKYYNNSNLWWVIAKYNPQVMFNPLYVPAGTRLIIPSINSLYARGGILNGY